MERFTMIALMTLTLFAVAKAAKLPLSAGDEPENHRQIGIISQDSEVNPDGSFHNVWEAENGIKVQEEGSVKVLEDDKVAQSVTGQISWTDLEGNPVVLSYVADENGYRPTWEINHVSKMNLPHPGKEQHQHPMGDHHHLDLPIIESN